MGGLNELCQSCLSVIGPKREESLPLCDSCYRELLMMPPETRMARIAELRKNEMLGELVDNLVELIEMSKRGRHHRFN